MRWAVHLLMEAPDFCLDYAEEPVLIADGINFLTAVFVLVDLLVVAQVGHQFVDVSELSAPSVDSADLSSLSVAKLRGDEILITLAAYRHELSADINGERKRGLVEVYKRIDAELGGNNRLTFTSFQSELKPAMLEALLLVVDHFVFFTLLLSRKNQTWLFLLFVSTLLSLSFLVWLFI